MSQYNIKLTRLHSYKDVLRLQIKRNGLYEHIMDRLDDIMYALDDSDVDADTYSKCEAQLHEIRDALNIAREENIRI